jgi:hypothetical protein
MATSADELTAQWVALCAEVAGHKRAIRRHREQLGVAKSALVELDAACRRRGIGLHIMPAADGEGEVRGRHHPNADPVA